MVEASELSGEEAGLSKERFRRRAAWAILALALLLRLVWLGGKPPHFDEGVNGWFIDQMRLNGFYHYQPDNYHGPFHFYVLFLAQTLFGREVAALRLPLALINAASVWLIFQYRRFLPWRVCFWAAAAFAVSPGMVFYSRYAIHEAWLVFGMMLGVWGAAEIWTRGSARGLWAAVAGVTLMILNKETFVLHLAAFGLAFPTLLFLEKASPSGPGFPSKPAPRQWRPKTFAAAVGCGLLALGFFYSGGFLDPSSLKGFFSAFAEWFKTGVQHHTGHEKPFPYWLELFGRYEWPALLGLAFCLRAVAPGMNRFSRFLAIYGCGTLLAYSLVPYKTPWCIISIAWPFFFLFGELAEEACRALAQKRAARRAVLGALAALVTASAALSVRLNFFHPTDAREKYVYVQTLNDLDRLTGPLRALTAADPAAYHLPILVLLSSYHPLPWVLGDFTAVAYYAKDDPPAYDAAVLIVEPNRVEETQARLRQPYFVEPFQLRDGMDQGSLYLSVKDFAHLFPGREPDFQPPPEPAAAPSPENGPGRRRFVPSPR